MPPQTVETRLACRICGRGPALPLEIKSHRGMILQRQTLTEPGPFCRDCGIATIREMTGDTFVQGWWGFLSFFITPMVLAGNLIKRRLFGQLPAPEGVSPQALDPGKPFYQRPTSLGALVPVVLIAAAAVAISLDSVENQVGNCVDTFGSNAKIVECFLSHDGVVIGIADSATNCPSGTDFTVERTRYGQNSDDGKLLCVRRVTR